MTSPAAAKERLHWVDAGRGLAILLVVAFHATNWIGEAGFPNELWVLFNQTVASLRMPLFFVMAGLFSQKWLSTPWRVLWASKISLFAWVFLLWSVISTFSFMLGLNMQGQQGNYFRQFLDLLWAPVLPRFELWFVWALFWFFIITKLTRRVPAWLQLGASAVLSFAALSGWIVGNIGWESAAKYFFFFLVGLLLREHIIRLSRMRKLPLSLTLVAWLGTSLAGVFLGWNHTVPGYYFATCVLGIGAGIALSHVLASLAGLRRMGARTLPVYLAHTPLVLIAAWLLWHLPDGAKSMGVGLLLIPALVAVATWTALKLDDLTANRPPYEYLFEAPPWFRAAPKPISPKS